MGVCTKERKGVTAAVLMATPCTNSLGGESGGQKHEGYEVALLFPLRAVCITKTEKAESEAQRSKPKGALGSESRNAIL